MHFEGHNEQFTGHDRISLQASGGGTQVTYDAQFDFHGASKVAVPLVAVYLPFLANKTVTHLRERLDRLGTGVRHLAGSGSAAPSRDWGRAAGSGSWSVAGRSRRTASSPT